MKISATMPHKIPTLDFPDATCTIQPFHFELDDLSQKCKEETLANAFSTTTSEYHRSFFLPSGAARNNALQQMDTAVTPLFDAFSGLMAASSWLSDVADAHQDTPLWAVLIMRAADTRYFGTVVIDANTMRPIDTAIHFKSDHKLMSQVTDWFADWENNCLNADLQKMFLLLRPFAAEQDIELRLHLVVSETPGDDCQILTGFESFTQAADFYRQQKLSDPTQPTHLECRMLPEHRRQMKQRFAITGELDKIEIIDQIATVDWHERNNKPGS